MTLTESRDVSARLAALLAERIEDVIDLWEELGEAGPTFGSPVAGRAEERRERYLRPLARVLVGALSGSADHAAIYLDERRRYASAELDASGCAAEFGRRLPGELGRLAGLVADRLPVDLALEPLEQLHRGLTEHRDPSARVLFIGDCLFVETRALLVAREPATPVDVRHIFFSTRQQLAEVNSAIVNEVVAYRPDVVGLSLFTFEGVPPFTAAWRAAAAPWGAPGATRSVAGLVELVRETIENIRSVSDATIVVHAPGGVPVGRWRRRLGALPEHSWGQRRLLRALRAGVRDVVAHTTNTILLDEGPVVAAAGGARRIGGPLFDPADVPAGYFHTTRLGARIAEEYAGVLDDHRLLARAKVLLVDLDNTLWAGVMGEGAVVHDRELQRLLLRLKQAGVLLVALSKNDPQTIRWDELELAPEDFVLHQINWVPKPDNVSQAVAALDLAASAFVLLDDNPVERALVTEQVPGVRAMDPAAPVTRRALERWFELPSTTQTAEARRRTEMYREAAERRSALSQTHDYATMMRSLRLRYDVRPAGPQDRDRVLELVQRTNQFNTTTQRRSAAEVDDLLADERYGVHVATLGDRFGDLGVVALAVFARERRELDAVIMSCRAMGFGLEIALVSRVLAAEGPGPVTATFVPTERNAPAADLFARAGFREVGAHRWELSVDADRPVVPEWFGRPSGVGGR
ncbi:HAD-IIIC family phosphatase [Nocardioides sp. dk4132]|uniref:HAD-IIIC family phosphatase n=1 Tax=unclassified Nocardioides TaxID=2615069 RepID=UPI0012965651|nr:MULTISPECIES: HAD-IIIC family phosphatase [unclassified Nocardioides]MQW78019.1 HAD-IIIC family phosphatase [Nocardioides sp. dk4132]QGA08126.1 HAD-IIIC family phosphatase [Nocardioides sp. dk884]